MQVLRQMALKVKDRDDWMGNSWGSANKGDIHFRAIDFFIVPDEFKVLYDEYKDKREKAEKEISALYIQTDSLITRIQLASDKTLQAMINEVDDMGDISLFDTKLKQLTNPKDTKEIE